MSNKEIKRKKLRYSSIIPKPNHSLTAYQLFNKTKYSEIKEDIPSSEKISRLSELWKNLPTEEVEIYKARAEAEKYEIKKEWDKTFESREEERRKWCVKFNRPLDTSWEELDAINRTEWVKLNPTVDKKKQTKSKKSKSKAGSDQDSSSSSEEEDQPQKRKSENLSNDGTKKKRAAVEHALLRMKESSGLLEDTNLIDSGDEDTGKKKNSKTHNASPKPGNTTGLLSGSYLSTSANISRNNSNLKEGKMLKKRTSRLGDVEWIAAIWSEERVKAILKGIDRVYEMALDQDNFDIFGNDMIQCFYDVATVTGEPVRSKTLKYVEHLANRWKYTVMQDGWKQDNAQPTPCEVIEVITGMYCMERVGIRHDLKAEVLKFLKSKKAYNAKDYFGWDPVNETLNEEGGIEVISDCIVSKYRLMSSSLIHSFYSDRVGLTLGCQYADIFRWLPVLRPYKGPHQLPWQDYIDQCYLITHIIFTTNNWGELSLDPALFPHEYYFLRNHLDIHIQQRDVHLIAEFVESLRCFGCTDDDPLIRKGMRTLLGLQTESGIWDPTEDEPYRTYHATMCAIQALLAHRFRGFGPGIPSVLPLLVQWSNELIDKNEEYRNNTREMNNQLTVVAEKVTELRELEYGPLVSGDIATEGSITKPKDITAHSTERMNTLKMAMRSFAKVTGNLFTVVPEPPSSIKTSEDIKLLSSKITNEAQINENNGLILDQLYQTIGSYLQHLGVVEKTLNSSSTTFTNEDSNNLLVLINKSTNIPVTASILQSNRYKNLTKNIRILSKGKGIEGVIDKNIQAACGKLMAEWKNYILTTSNKTNSESDKTDSNSQNNDFSSLNSPKPQLKQEQEQEQLIEETAMEVGSNNDKDNKEKESKEEEQATNVLSSSMEIVTE